MNQVFEQFPVLETERLKLIEITNNHLADIFAIFSNEEVTRYYNLVTLAELEDARPIIDWFTLKYADKKGLRWGITEKISDKLIGTIGYNNFTWGQKGLIGYDLNCDFWNKGYATEAIKAIVGFGFDAFGLNRIEAEVMPANVASGKALVKSGFTLEGTIRKSLFWEGKWYDMNMYSILSEEWGVGK